MLAPGWPASGQLTPRAIVTLERGCGADCLVVLTAVDCDDLPMLSLVPYAVALHHPVCDLRNNAGGQACG